MSRGHRTSLVLGAAILLWVSGCGGGTKPERAGSEGSGAPKAGRAAPEDPRRRARSFVLASPGRMPACRPAPARVGPPVDRPRWLGGVAVTEYYPVPERWFSGRRVKVPGLRTRHRVDWLYSARGVLMQGEGVALNGRRYGVERVGEGTWVSRRGEPTVPGRCAGRWSEGWPVWFAGGWRNRDGQVTFPLAGRAGWANGVGRGKRRPVDATFAPRPQPKARPDRTVAVDPDLIPRGSRIYIPAYRRINGGWFVAEDTGGAIVGRHIDVYRRPPRSPADRGGVLRGQRIKVVPPS